MRLTTTSRSGDSVTLHIHSVAKLQEDGVSRMVLSRVVSTGPLRATAFLSVEHARAPDDLWVYLPALQAPRRLVASNLGDSYLGSEFRYGDLVQPDPDDYLVTLRGTATTNGERCWVIEAVPRRRRLARDTGIGRLVVWLSRERPVERRVEQYDRRGTLLKVMQARRWTSFLGGRKWLALERHIRNVQSGATSSAIFERVEVGTGIPAALFAPPRLSERTW